MNPDEKISFTDALHRTLKRDDITDQERGIILQGIDHYRNEYQKHQQEGVDPISISVGFNTEIQKHIDEKVLADKENIISCKAGCAFCCYVQVTITSDEAKALIEWSKENDIRINYERLQKQAQAGDDSIKHVELKFADRKCVFLGDDNLCRVYEHRPGSCRKYMVSGDPKECDTEINPGGQVLNFIDVYAEMMVSGAFNAVESGPMAQMILKEKK